MSDINSFAQRRIVSDNNYQQAPSTELVHSQYSNLPQDPQHSSVEYHYLPQAENTIPFDPHLIQNSSGWYLSQQYYNNMASEMNNRIMAMSGVCSLLPMWSIDTPD
jgi:hypothetical protein